MDGGEGFSAKNPPKRESGAVITRSIQRHKEFKGLCPDLAEFSVFSAIYLRLQGAVFTRIVEL